MKKLAKKIAMGALAMMMCASIATAQAATIDAGQAKNSSLVQQSAVQSDTALANSMGLGNSPTMKIMNNHVTSRANSGINLFSGNLAAQFDLIYDYGNSGGGGLSLYYNSMNDEEFGMGQGFRTNYHAKLEAGYNNEDAYLFVDPSGTHYVFRLVSTSNSSSIYQDIKGRELRVAKVNGYPKYEITGEDYTYTFAVNPDQMTQLANNSNGTSSRITCDNNGRIMSVANYKKGSLTTSYSYIYDDAGTLMGFTTNQVGVSYRLSYDPNGLTSIVAYGGVTGFPSISVNCDMNHKLTGVFDCSISYLPGQDGKVSGYTDFNETASFLYGNLQTVISIQGGEMSLYQFDADGSWINRP